jgi:hypothetical protein
MEKLSSAVAMDSMTNTDSDPMTMTPYSDAPADHRAGRQDSWMTAGRCHQTTGLRRRRGHGMYRSHRDGCNHERSNYGQTKKDMSKFDGFHKNDPPLIVEIIVELRSNRLMN